MTQEQLEGLRSDISVLCRSIAPFMRNEITRITSDDIISKDRNSLVSYVDKEVEKRLVSGLSSLVPQAGFITEENTVSQEKQEFMWVVDPLDGTTNYLYQIPHYSITFALLQNMKPVLGIVYEVGTDVAFTAIEGMGAWENDKNLAVSSQSVASDSMVATGFPYKRDEEIDARMAVFRHAILNYRGMRRIGSAALELAYVASGRLDLFYENTLNIWDIAAGTLLVREAGGIVTDFSGGQDFFTNGAVLASNNALHPGMLNVVKEYLA